MKTFNMICAFLLAMHSIYSHAADHALLEEGKNPIPCMNIQGDNMTSIGIGYAKGCVWKIPQENNHWSVSLGYLYQDSSMIVNTSIFAINLVTKEPSSIHVSGVVNCNARGAEQPALLSAYNSMAATLQEKKLLI